MALEELLGGLGEVQRADEGPWEMGGSLLMYGVKHVPVQFAGAK